MPLIAGVIGVQAADDDRARLVECRVVGDAEVQAVKTAGFTDGEIGEIVAAVALNVFTNYFNETAKTTVDFPAIEFPLKTLAASS